MAQPSGGFAFVHGDSTCDVTAVECVPVDDLDPALVKAGLDTYSKAAAAAAEGSAEAAKAQIGVEVHEAMAYALEVAGTKA